MFIRDYGIAGQQPGSTGPVPTELHGPISLGPKANRVYFAHGTGRAGIIQIVDRDKLLNGPKEPTDANLLYPQITRVDLPPDAGAHTALPLLGMTLAEFAKQKPPANAPKPDPHDHGDRIPLPASQAHRDFLAVVSETTNEECLEPRQIVRMMDITFEKTPVNASTWTVPETSGNFCERGGRFGAHASQENNTPIYYGRVLFVTYFNAGIRVLDIRDPYNLKEIGYLHPGDDGEHRQAVRGRGRSRAVQDRDPDQQRRGRRPRLRLRGRSREHRHAHPGADGRGPQRGEFPGPEHGPAVEPFGQRRTFGSDWRMQ